MSEREARKPPATPGDEAPGEPDEGFLSRWSRLKERSRRGPEAGTAPETAGQAPEAALPTGGGPAADGPSAAEPPGDEDMPPLESLGPESDYSAFMSPRVSPALRRQALRRLFSSPKFNITDGLDDYCEDFTKWRPLGDIVTADMRHQMERRLKEAMEAGEEPADESGQVRQAAAGEGGPAEPGDAQARGDEPGPDAPGTTHEDSTADPPPGDEPNEPGKA